MGFNGSESGICGAAPAFLRFEFSVALSKASTFLAGPPPPRFVRTARFDMGSPFVGGTAAGLLRASVWTVGDFPQALE